MSAGCCVVVLTWCDVPSPVGVCRKKYDSLKYCIQKMEVSYRISVGLCKGEETCQHPPSPCLVLTCTRCTAPLICYTVLPQNMLYDLSLAGAPKAGQANMPANEEEQPMMDNDEDAAA